MTKHTPTVKNHLLFSALAVVCRPAIAILNRISYVAKFLLVGLLLLAPFGYVTQLLIKASDKQIVFNQKERYGVEYITPAFRLLRNVQYLRLYSTVVLQGSTSYEDSLGRVKSSIDVLVPLIDAVDAKYRESFRADDGRYPCSERWTRIKERWAILKTVRFQTAAECIAAYTDFSALITDWILNGAANYSNLILDPDLDSYWLMDAFVAKLPGLTEDLSRSAALTLTFFKPGKDFTDTEGSRLAATQRLELSGLYADARSTLDALIRVNLATAYQYSTANGRNLVQTLDPLVPDAVARSEQFLEQIKATILTRDDGTVPEAGVIVAQVQGALDRLYVLYDGLGPELEALINARVAAYQRDETLGRAAAEIATFLDVFIFIALFLAVRESIAMLGDFTTRMIAGTTESFTLPCNDELGHVAGMYNKINETLLQTRLLKTQLESRSQQLTELNTQLVAMMEEQKRLEGELVHAQKLESIGQLAAGVAHEINTPTQYVGDNVRFLQQVFADLNRLLTMYEGLLSASRNGGPTPELLATLEKTIEEVEVDYLRTEVPKSIQQSIDGLDRVSEIVRALKDFSNPTDKEKTLVDLNSAIETTLTVASNEWKYVADVVKDFARDLPSVPGLPGELNQVFLNIIVNAAHAIAEVKDHLDGDKGSITVQTRHDASGVEVRISDTGSGIPESARGRIFDPFFTTKQVGKGTGQGLAVAHAVVVKKHGGTIEFETEVGRGTTFLIRLLLESAVQEDALAAS